MPEFKLQRLRGGWAIAVYDGGRRISRKQLEAGDAATAAEEFRLLKAEAMKPVAPTVRQVWGLYVADREGRVIAGNMVHSGKAVLPYFGDMKADAITTEDCRAYAASRRKAKRQDGTIHTELGHLRIALRWGEKHGLAKAPPIERPQRPAPMDRHLTREQFRRLLDGCGAPHVRVFCHLAIATGGRSAALLDLTWDRVSFERGLVFLGKAEMIRPQKGRATVPMTNALRAALSEAKQGALTDRVIEYAGEPVKKIRRGLSAAAGRAKVGHVTPHMLRHSAAVWMAEDGVPMREIAQFLGHSDVRITERVYAVFSPDYLRRAANSLEI